MSRTPRTDRPDLLPEARDAEAMLIGSILIDPSMIDECAGIVSADDFERLLYRDVWAAAVKRRVAGEPVDYALLAADVGSTNAGADVAMTDAMMATPSAVHAPAYARMVAAASTRRGLIAAAADVAQWAHEGDSDIDGMVAASQRVFEAFDNRLAVAESGAIGPVFDAIEAGTGARGFATGIGKYDEWSPGLRPAEVHIISGYSGVGKSWLACQVANAVLDAGGRVAFFSLEMPATSMMRRLMANRAGAAALRYGNENATFTGDELARIHAAKAALLGADLRVYHDQRSLAQIGAMTRRTQPDLAVVDYGQLMDAPARGMRPYEANAENANGLQALAQRANCCVVVLSQVNEENQRSAGADQSHGLKGAGEWAAVADFILRIKNTDEAGVVKIWAQKNRHGIDVHGDAMAELRMDKATGKLMPKLAVVAPSAYGDGYMGRTMADA